MTLKHILYDWYGLNEALFYQINDIRAGAFYDRIMLLLTHIGDRHLFLPYLVALAAIAVGSIILRKAKGGAATKHMAQAWIGVFLVLIAAFIVNAGIIHELKNSFAYSRPYEALGTENVRVLEYVSDEADSAHNSFPSGHASFITLMIAGLWPILPVGLEIGGVLLVFGVCWSRLAVGMHFPADVLTGCIVGLISVLMVRAIVYKLLLKSFNLKC